MKTSFPAAPPALAVATLIHTSATRPRGSSPGAKTASKKMLTTRTAAVTVTTYMDRSFTVDGKPWGDLRAGDGRKAPRSLRVGKLEAVSVAADQDRREGTIDLSKPVAKPAAPSVSIEPKGRLDPRSQPDQVRMLVYGGARQLNALPLAIAMESRVSRALDRTDQIPVDLNRDRALQERQRDDDPVVTLAANEESLQAGQRTSLYQNAISGPDEGPGLCVLTGRKGSAQRHDLGVIDGRGHASDSDDLNEARQAPDRHTLAGVKASEHVTGKQGALHVPDLSAGPTAPPVQGKQILEAGQDERIPGEPLEIRSYPNCKPVAFTLALRGSVANEDGSGLHCYAFQQAGDEDVVLC